MTSKKNLEQLILTEIENGVGKEDLIRNLIFAGWSYRDVSKTLERLNAKGHIPAEFWTRHSVGRVVREPSYQSVGQSFPNASTQTLNAQKKRRMAMVFLGVFVVVCVAVYGVFFFISHSPRFLLKKTISLLPSLTSVRYVGIVTIAPSSDAFAQKIFSDKEVVIMVNGIARFIPGQNPQFSSTLSLGRGDVPAGVIGMWDATVLFPGNGEWYERLNSARPWENEMVLDDVYGRWVSMNNVTSSAQSSILAPPALFKAGELLSSFSSDTISLIRSDVASLGVNDSVVRVGTEKESGVALTHLAFHLSPTKARNLFGKWVGTFQGDFINALVEGEWHIWIDDTFSVWGLSIRNQEGSVRSIDMRFGQRNTVNALSVPPAVLSLEAFEGKVKIMEQE